MCVTVFVAAQIIKEKKRKEKSQLLVDFASVSAGLSVPRTNCSSVHSECT